MRELVWETIKEIIIETLQTPIKCLLKYFGFIKEDKEKSDGEE